MDLKIIPALVLLGCGLRAPASSPRPADALALVGEANQVEDVDRLAASAKWTVFVFFSPDCRCLRVHEARLRALDAIYRPHGVRFYWVDSEVGSSRALDSTEAQERRYSFPILLDPGAKVADALGAEFATASIVLDAAGTVRYRGGIDSDKDHLREDATPYLRDALDDLLAGREPRLAEGEALGCALRKR